MASYNQRVRVNLSASLFRSFGLALLTLVLVSLGLEALARTPWVQSRLPFQAFGTNHIQFEMQMANFRAFVAENGPPECLIMGTSMALRDIDPEVMAAVYKRQKGEDLVCYNFAVNAIQVSTSELLAEILMDEFQPKLLIIGTSFLDYTQHQEGQLDDRFASNDWMNYRLGRFSLKGWLTEHSYAFRLILLLSYSAPEGLRFTDLDGVGKEILKWQNQLTRYGYGESEVVAEINRLTAGQLKRFLDQFGDYALSRRNVNGIEAFAQLQEAQGVQVIIVQLPHHPYMVNVTDPQGNPVPEAELVRSFLAEVELTLRQITADYGVLFIDTEAMGELPGNVWKDLYHLNVLGSPILSEWLTLQIIAAEENGDILDLQGGN